MISNISMELNDKQKKILEVLKDEKLATSKIAYLTTLNLYRAEDYLNQLFDEGLVNKEHINNATYWSLK